MTFNNGEHITIPSPIDVHTHLREPGGEDKETIESGTLAAIAGGYQAVFDMPNNPNHHETWSEGRIDEKVGIAKATAHTNIGFYAGVNLSNPALEEFPGMVRKAAGLKLYMDHTTGNVVQRGLESVRPVIDEWMAQARSSGSKPPILLHAREAVGAETAEYVAAQEYPVHWCHISTETEASMAAALTAKCSEWYTGGVTPHHLTMTGRNADYQQGWNGARMQPPLGKEVDAEALLAAYNRGDLQILETDHAPHTAADKFRAESENPEGHSDVGCTTCFGVSGIEFVLPVMMSLVQRKKITIERLVDSLHDKPMKMLGLKLGGAAVANTTTLKISPYVLEPQDIVGNSANTPYIGWTAWADVVAMQKNGRLIEDFIGTSAADHGPVEILRTGSVI
jgi:dihydroorotase